MCSNGLNQTTLSIIIVVLNYGTHLKSGVYSWWEQGWCTNTRSIIFLQVLKEGAYDNLKHFGDLEVLYPLYQVTASGLTSSAKRNLSCDGKFLQQRRYISLQSVASVICLYSDIDDSSECVHFCYTFLCLFLQFLGKILCSCVIMLNAILWQRLHLGW